MWDNEKYGNLPDKVVLWKKFFFGIGGFVLYMSLFSSNDKSKVKVLENQPSLFPAYSSVFWIVFCLVFGFGLDFFFFSKMRHHHPSVVCLEVKCAHFRVVAFVGR
jgi:hypothetical protein